jgi:hypothetical protein
VGPVLLFGGWFLMQNPDARNSSAPLSTWKKVRSYDTSYLCEQGRHKEAVSAAEHDRAKSPTVFELSYRCVREEHVEGLKHQ